MVEKVTRMLIKVDLQCKKCYRKIKKVLCRFPQIRDQIYDEKQNTVTITVVCCSPEKIKDKIRCKGGNTILCIEIIPDKPKGTEKQKVPEKQKDPEKQKEPEKPKETTIVMVNEMPTPPTKLPEPDPPKPHVPVPPTPQVPAPGCLPPFVVGICCCQPCYRGYGPCPHCYNRPPQMCHDGCGRPAYECQGGNRVYYVCRCCDYFSEENASGCIIM